MEETQPEKTVQDIQQQFANSVGCRGGIVWDRFSENDKDVLTKKIELLFPLINESNCTSKNELPIIKKKNFLTLKKRKYCLAQLWAKRAYCGGKLKMSIIYVSWTPKIDKNASITVAKDATTFTSHPVFRIWKCSVEGESKDCCKTFIDENGRVYDNWDHFIKNNTYPKGILVGPKDGIYELNEDDEVVLEFHITPNGTSLNKALHTADTSVSVVGILGAAIPVGLAMVTPIGAPLVIGSIAVGIATTAYSMGRSIANLIDRGHHKQSIKFSNSKSRQNWLNIVGGIVSLGAKGATIGVAKHLAKGNALPQIVEKAVRGVNAASIATSGAGLGNGVVEVIKKINKNEDFSSLEILQLSSSLCLFTHSIYNYQLATKILENANGNIFEMEHNLFSEQQDFFTEMINKTLLLQGGSAVKCIDLIRNLDRIPDIASGLISLNLSKLDTERICEMAKNIVGKYFVCNENALNNCLNILVQNLSVGAIDLLVLKTEVFLEDIIKTAQNKLKSVIPFEHILWDIYDISINLTNGSKTEITEEYLLNNMDKIIEGVKKHYCDYVDQDSELGTKCKYCPGYYRKIKLR